MDMQPDDRDQQLREVQRAYLDFLDDEEDQGIYQSKVRDMITDGHVRLTVNINDLRRKNPERAQKLLGCSFEEMISFQRALKDFVSSIDTVYSKQHEEFFIGFEGSFGSRHVTPRSLTSHFLSNMVCVEGIVTKCSLVRPKVVRSVHYCPTTKKTIERRYTDMTSLDAFPASSVYPTKDDEGNALETEYGLSTYKDHQTFTVQEMPEKAPAGQLPRSVDVIVDDDLVDCCKPGDRVQIIGMYRCLPGKKNGYTTGTFRTVCLANNIQLLSKERAPTFQATDIANIKKFSKVKGQDVFEVLSRSLAPTIHGHAYIKKAILAMLLGGVERVLENGTRLRGDINVMLIGDPSVAKSQMLRYVLNTAPRAIPTTGRGTTGVGLTAAVTTDPESGERNLEAGAMVLADRGVVCIDEFDKMSDMDRTAIHEVMEQGRVTIAKAGIHAKLNARCSVLAAANPVYGRYDQYKTPMENIGLQDSLLSRFDLLFIVLDTQDPDHDRRISDHVLRIHRYRNPNEQDGDVLSMGAAVDLLATTDPNTTEEEERETPIYEKFDSLLHGLDRKAKKDRIISMGFMRKYIHVARDLKPQLTRDAADLIADEYTKLRSQENLSAENVAKTQPVTPRTLETLIRIATAHAKCRMAKTVDIEDAEAAVEVLEFAYFKKVETKKRRKRGHSSSDEDEVDDEDREQRKARRQRVKKTRPEVDAAGAPTDPDDPYNFDSEAASEAEEPETLDERRRARSRSKSQTRDSDEAMDATPTADVTPAAAATVSAERLSEFKTSLLNVFKAEHAQSVLLDKVKAFVNKEASTEFSDAELRACLDEMMEQNQVMLADDVVFLI